MARAEITDGGLARRLGEQVSVIKAGGNVIRGTLVFYPNRFAVHTESADYRLLGLDVIQLRSGSVIQRPYVRDYVYGR